MDITTFFKKQLPVFAGVLLWLSGSVPALASSGGITGRTISGCGGGGCHTQNTATTVSIQGYSGTITMAPGEQRSFTAIVAHSSQPRAGINLSVKNGSNQNAGSFSAGSNTQVSGGEITHTGPTVISGGQATFGFTWTAPTQTGTYTMRAVGNAVNNNGQSSGDEWNSMSNITVIVEQNGITVNTPNGGEVLCKGGTQNITWTASGVSGNVNIDLGNGSGWTNIGSAATSAGSFSWNIPANQQSGNTYRVRVMAGAVGDTSNADFSIRGNPSITSHPTGANLCPGGSHTLTVGVTNPTEFTYQWRLNSNPINGATNSSYTISSLGVGTAGNYDVQVVGCTTVTSSQAAVTLRQAPSISIHPQSRAVCPNTPANLSVTAAGEGLTYQWRKNGSNIGGATEASYTIASVTASDTATYDVVVAGACSPPATSAGAKISFQAAPAIASQPRDTIVCENTEARLVIVASGASTFEWRKNGQTVPNAVGSVLIIGGVTPADTGYYDAAVRNECGQTVNSAAAHIQLRPLTAVTSQPRDTTVQKNFTAVFKITANGANLKYLWHKGTTARPKDTTATLTIANAQAADSGLYNCVVTGTCGIKIQSAQARLRITEPPAGPALALALTSVDFQCVKVSSAKDTTLAAVVSNAGGTALNVTDVKIAGDNAFTLTSGGGTFTLQAGEKRALGIRFAPAAAGQKTAQIEFTSNTTTTSPTIALTGKGCVESVNTAAISLGSPVEVGKTKDTTVKICNNGDLPVTVTAITLAGAGAAQFTLSNPILPVTMAAGECLEIQVVFAPTTVGAVTAEITVQTLSKGTYAIPLQGAGAPASGVAEITEADGIALYPNPTTGAFVLNFRTQTAMPAELRVVNMSGETVYRSTLAVFDGGAHTAAWSGDAPAGRYTALLTLGARTLAVPFVIAR